MRRVVATSLLQTVYNLTVFPHSPHSHHKPHAAWRPNPAIYMPIRTLRAALGWRTAVSAQLARDRVVKRQPAYLILPHTSYLKQIAAGPRTAYHSKQIAAGPRIAYNFCTSAICTWPPHSQLSQSKAPPAASLCPRASPQSSQQRPPPHVQRPASGARAKLLERREEPPRPHADALY